MTSTISRWSQFSEEGETSGGNHSLRFGKLNVIVLDAEEFAAWREATDALIARKPVTKQEAKAFIEETKKRRILESAFI
jgi:uncharacterized HAD superfamily protein